MKFFNDITTRTILEITNGITISELNKKIDIQASYLSVIISSLVNNDVIDIINDTDDRRMKIIFFTEKGLLLQLTYGYIKDLMELEDGTVC